MEIPKGADQVRYRKQVQQGVELVEKSFASIEETKHFPQKTELLDKAMREALEAVQDSARGLVNKKLIEEKLQLEKDYDQYMQNPNAGNGKKVKADIDQLKTSAKKL